MGLTEATTHCSLSGEALWPCPALPQGARRSAADLRGSFPAGATQAIHVPQPGPPLPAGGPLSPFKWAIGRIGDQAVKCLAHCLAHSEVLVSVSLWTAASSPALSL